MLWGMLVTLAATWFAAGFAAAWVLYRREPEVRVREDPREPLQAGDVYSNGVEELTIVDTNPWRVIVATKTGAIRGLMPGEFLMRYPNRITKGAGS